MRTARYSVALLAAAVATQLAWSGPAPDPVPLYPSNYKVLVENDKVRVLEFVLRAGDSEVAHRHPAHVAVFLSEFEIEFTLPDGTKRRRTGKPGEVAFSEALVHAPVNRGTQDARGILIELKSNELPADALVAATLIHGLAGKDQELKQHLLSLAAPTRAEPGNLRYDLYQSTRAPHEFFRLEAWTSDAALEQHKAAPHLRQSFQKRQAEGWTTEILTFRRVEEDLPEPRPVGRIERFDPRADQLVAVGTTVEAVADGFSWSEGPLWDTRTRSLLLSDVPNNRIMRWRPASAPELVLSPSGYSGTDPFRGAEPGSNGLTFDREGRLVFCQHGDRRIVRREHDGRLTVLADRFEGKRLNSPNDLVYRSNGDLYFTDPPFGLPGSFADPNKQLDFQGVYRLRPDGTLTVVTRQLRAPNGLAFSPDERTLYVSNADNADPVWMAFPVLDDGSLGPGRRFADARAWVKPGEGVPDGLKVDQAGNLFAAAPGGVHVLAPDGTRLARIETGAKTGNVAWGEDGSTLFIAADKRILRVRTKTLGRIPGA